MYSYFLENSQYPVDYNYNILKRSILLTASQQLQIEQAWLQSKQAA